MAKRAKAKARKSAPKSGGGNLKKVAAAALGAAAVAAAGIVAQRMVGRRAGEQPDAAGAAKGKTAKKRPAKRK